MIFRITSLLATLLVLNEVGISVEAVVGSTATSKGVTVLYEISGDIPLSEAMVLSDENSIFVGSSNSFIHLFLPGNSETVTVTSIDFQVSANGKENCVTYLGDVPSCENIVRVLEVSSSKQLLVCGTNALDPKCSYYDSETKEFTALDVDADEWLHETNRLAIFFDNDLPTGRSLYIATTEGQLGKLRRKISPSLTSQDSWFASEPEYVGIYEQPSSKYVYVLLNDKSKYFSGDKFVGEDGGFNYYSFVGRVCKNDNGGTYYDGTWMTFTRIRLLCAWPRTKNSDVTDLHYDEMVTSYKVNSILYTLSRPNRKWQLPNYAVARYDLGTIDDYLDGKSTNDVPVFVDNNNPANEARYTEASQPFTPGQCPSVIPYSVPGDLEIFVTTHSLVKAIASPIDNIPFHIGVENVNYKFLFVQEFASTSAIYLLSEGGIMKKLLLHSDGTSTEMFHKQVLENDESIVNAKIVEERNSIIAVTATSVISIPLSFCGLHRSCESCNEDPFCYWKSNTNSTAFLCEETAEDQPKRCYAKPDPPAGLAIMNQNGSFYILWEGTDGVNSNGIFHLITVVLKTQNKVVQKTKIRPSSESSMNALLDRSAWQSGRVYEVRVSTVNGNSMSAEVRTTFIVAMSKPKVNVRHADALLRFEWLPVIGASQYKIQVFDSEMVMLEDVSYQAEAAYRKYYHPVLGDRTFSAYITAESDDLVRSTTVVKFNSRDDCPEWSFNYTAEPIADGDIRLPANDSVVEPPSQADDESLQGKADCTNQASQQIVIVDSSGNTGIFTATSLNIILAIVISICVFIIARNNIWVIQPAAKYLTDEDGYVYHRRFYLFWFEKRVKRKRQYVNEGEDDVEDKPSKS